MRWKINRKLQKLPNKMTKDALELSDHLFQHFKDYEKLMEKQLEAAGRKSDPYRASQPDNYKILKENLNESRQKFQKNHKSMKMWTKSKFRLQIIIATPSVKTFQQTHGRKSNNHFWLCCYQDKQPAVC